MSMPAVLWQVDGERCFDKGIEASLSVVTVNYNSESALRRFVKSLDSAGCVEQLVVVDHSRSDHLASLEANFPIQIIRQRNRGYGGGLNRGLQEIHDTSGLILLCNPDIVLLNPEAIDAVWRHMNDNPDVGLLVPALVDAQMNHVSSCRRFYSLASLMLVSNPWLRKLIPDYLKDPVLGTHRGLKSFEADWASGAAMFIRGSMAKNGPLFDERFFLYFEDVDLCARIWQEQLSVVYFPDLVCQHEEGRLSHKKFRYFLIHLASLFKFVLKYKGLPQRAALQGVNGFAERDPSDMLSFQVDNGPMEHVQAPRATPNRG